MQTLTKTELNGRICNKEFHTSNFGTKKIMIYKGMKKALWTFVNRFLCGFTFTILLGIYLGAELLSHIITLCLTFWGTARLLPKVTAHFYTPTSCVWGFQFLHPHEPLLFLSLSLFFFIKTILAGMKYCFFLALACISLMTVDIE